MNICNMLYETTTTLRNMIDSKKANGLTESAAIEEIVDEAIRQTKAESENGVVHGVVERFI